MNWDRFEEMCMVNSIFSAGHALLTRGMPVDTGHWQALRGVPQTKTIELQNVVLQVQVGDPNTGEVEWIEQIGPNLPWAENQFQERVAGKPVNPGETYKDWPYYKGNVEEHKEPGTFSHTYAERFWPKQAGLEEMHVSNKAEHFGIRYDYGDLNDVVNLLVREPYTRQAYLPIWFPEDTGAHHGERVPCTLGYHFMLREGKLNITYFIRSVDMIRHFPDDVYMAMRLCQWVLAKLGSRFYERTTGVTDEWNPSYVKPGTLTMHMCSLHFFDHKSDWRTMRKLYG